MAWLVSLLNLFGITPEKYPFLVIGFLIIGGVVYIRVSIGGKLGKIKDNVLIVITHLSSAASKRGRLDTSLIQVMSPMTITDQGHAVLQDSGFKTVMGIAAHRSEVMNAIATQEPKTKLDVENYSIVYFSTFLERDFMQPVKTYLYNNPNIRESYTTLAGVFIRDEYLRDHPEITV